MDHIVYLDAKNGEMESLLHGRKSMIIREASGLRFPNGRVSEGDVLYFINNNSEDVIKAKGVVATVYCSEMLTEEESFETVVRNQDKLQLPDCQFERFAGKKYLALIGVENMEKLDSFRINRSHLLVENDWIIAGNINEYILSNHGIMPASSTPNGDRKMTTVYDKQ